MVRLLWMEGGGMRILDAVTLWPLETIQEGSGVFWILGNLWVKNVFSENFKEAS